MDSEFMINNIEEAQLLKVFKTICIQYNDPAKKMSLRNMLSFSSDKLGLMKKLAYRMGSLSINDNQACRLNSLISAFLKKSNYRKNVSIEVRERLLSNQNYKCTFCGSDIDLSSHADHIVPFKYVGDELTDNIQMLCTNCNEKKSDSIDYQIRVLLKIV